jgi:hypothetical protein
MKSSSYIGWLNKNLGDAFFEVYEKTPYTAFGLEATMNDFKQGKYKYALLRGPFGWFGDDLEKLKVWSDKSTLAKSEATKILVAT